jgi:putative ubiquitin-RnfH superfamily antitoxin RatB of RatAB toxin-antitoxin module
VNVGVAYANTTHQLWSEIDVPEGSTVQDAIEQSGILEHFPDINLERQKIGIYGKFVKLHTCLREGDRVEIYRPIMCDPTQVQRRISTESPPRGAKN